MTTPHHRGNSRPRRRGGIWSALAPYLLSFVAALALLGLLEAGLRLFRPQDVRMTTVDRASGDTVTWGLPDSVLGHRLRPNTRSIESAPEFTAEYLTDVEGFRAGEVAAAAPSGGTRTLVLGDSYAFGYGVHWDSTWSNRLARLAAESGTPLDIVNTGTPGYDTRSAALMLERTIARYRPSVVMVVFLPHDVVTNLPILKTETAQREVQRRVEQIGNAKFGGLHSVQLAKRLAMQMDRTYCNLYLATPRKEYFAVPLSPHMAQQVATTRALLSRIAQVSRAHGARMVVVSVPQLFQVLHVANGYDFEGIDPHWVDREFGAHASADGYQWLPTLDRLAALHRSGAGDLYYPFDGHLNTKGSDAVARVIQEHRATFTASSEAM